MVLGLVPLGDLGVVGWVLARSSLLSGTTVEGTPSLCHGCLLFLGLGCGLDLDLDLPVGGLMVVSFGSVGMGSL